jgi:competence protein ComEC
LITINGADTSAPFLKSKREKMPMNGKSVHFAIGAMLGILCALQEFLPYFLIFLFYFYVLYRYKSFSKKMMYQFFFIFILYGMVGFVAHIENKTEFTGKETNFEVQIRQAEINGDQLQMTVKNIENGEKLLLQYKIKTAQEKINLEDSIMYGSKCSITGTLKLPSTSRNPNAFNYQQYLAYKQIFWILTAGKSPFTSCLPSKATFISATEKIRHIGMNYVKTYFPEPTASLAVALLFGERDWMPQELISSYQKIGIVHLLAISGLQVTFLTGIIFLFGIRLGVVREKMISIMIIFLPFYALVTGASPSVVRAVLMMLFILVSLRVSKSRFSPLDALCGAFLVSLLYSPYLIFDVGFQLSFAACTALILSTQILKDRSSITQLLLTTWLAQIATLPTILFNFYEFSLISIVANLLFVPLFSAILSPVIFFMFILYPFIGFLLYPFLQILNKVVILTNDIIEWLSQLPYHMITLGKPSLPLLILYIIAIFVTFIKWERNRSKLLKGSYFLIVPFLFQIIFNIWSPQGEITFIDVGQGDSILVKMPYNQGTYLIDTGGAVKFGKEDWQEKNKTFEVGNDIVVPFLKSKGITTLDKLILTHGDYDHIGAAGAIIEQLNVKEILFPDISERSKLEVEIIHLANQKGIKSTLVSEGDSWKIGENQFLILSPSRGEDADKNNGSTVIYAIVGGLSWLFTGDIEQEMEKKLTEKYPFDIAILKVGHHGSKSSSSEVFLQQFYPEMAIISVGEKNRYGHPQTEVLSRLEKLNIQVLRTDQHGAISYIFKRGKGTFSVWIP